MSLTGTIIKGIGGFYYVKINDYIVECKAKGVFRKQENSPLIGDMVDICVLDEAKKLGIIEKIHDRTSNLIRPAVANVNQLVIVVPCADPAPDLYLVDKLILAALSKKIKPVLFFNKTDLVDEKLLDDLLNQYTNSGVDCIKTNQIEKINIDIIKDVLKNKITAFAGQSGVGKSTLLNTIMNCTVMQTGQISGKISRGKHTTRHAELFPLAFGGYIVDTPGFSSFEIYEIDYQEIKDYYGEFEKLPAECKYNGCIHVNEPKCTVKSMVEQGEINSFRYERYKQLVLQEKDKYDNRWR